MQVRERREKPVDHCGENDKAERKQRQSSTTPIRLFPFFYGILSEHSEHSLLLQRTTNAKQSMLSFHVKSPKLLECTPVRMGVTPGIRGQLTVMRPGLRGIDTDAARPALVVLERRRKSKGGEGRDEGMYDRRRSSRRWIIHTQWTYRLPARDEPLLLAPHRGPLVLGPARRTCGCGLLAVGRRGGVSCGKIVDPVRMRKRENKGPPPIYVQTHRSTTVRYAHSRKRRYAGVSSPVPGAKKVPTRRPT